MQFETATTMANGTSTADLCRAWGTTSDDVIDCKTGKRPMTLREAGALAELHGLKLADVLAV